MTTEETNPPAVVLSTALLDVNPERSAFETWLNPGRHPSNVSPWVPPGRYEKDDHQLAWLAWQAAVEAEREACANVCDVLAHEWRGANSQITECATAIRKRSNAVAQREP